MLSCNGRSGCCTEGTQRVQLEEEEDIGMFQSADNGYRLHTRTHDTQNKLEPKLVLSKAPPLSDILLCTHKHTRTHSQGSGWNQRVLAVWCSVPPVFSQHSPQLHDYTGVWQKHTVMEHRGAACACTSVFLCTSAEKNEYACVVVGCCVLACTAFL